MLQYENALKNLRIRLIGIAMAMTTSTDLLRKVKSLSDGGAWRDFLLTYEPFIESWLRGRGLDEHRAGDVRQEVMCVLVRELPNFVHNGNTGAFRAWLRKVMVNQLRSYRREQLRIGIPASPDFDLALAALERDDGDLVSQWDREHNCFLVSHLLTTIATDFAPQTIEAFKQQVFHERSADEVAELLQIPKASVITAKSRVLRRLRKHAVTLEDLL